MTCINILLGTGPIIVPSVFCLAGLGLGTIWMIVMMLISYMAVEFIMEIVSILNALRAH